MKHLKSLLVIICFCALVFVAGCTEKVKFTLEVTTKNLTLEVDQEVSLPVQTDGTLKVEISNSEVLEYNNNILKAKKTGEVTITVSLTEDETIKETINVVVNAKKLTIVAPSTLYVNSSYNLNNGENPSLTDVVFTSNNESVAIVQDGIVKGLKIGSATITMMVGDDNVGTFDVSVKKELVLECEYLFPTASLTYSITGATEEVASVVSQNEEIVTFSGTTINGQGVGIATATVTLANGVVTTVSVEVFEKNEMIVDAPSEIMVGEQSELGVVFGGREDSVFKYESSDKSIATVSSKGVIKAVKEGTVTITVTSRNGLVVQKDIQIVFNPENVESIEIEFSYEGDKLYIDTLGTLSIKAYPEGAYNDVEWSFERGATACNIREDGTIEFFSSTRIVIVATSKYKKTIKASFEITPEKTIDPQKFLKTLGVDEAVMKKIYVTGFENNGASSYWYYLTGGITKLYFDDIAITDNMLPNGRSNRPGTITNKMYYVTIHDTAAASSGSNGLANSNWCTNPQNETSWHYTVGNDGIFHQIPDNEWAYHAGDGTRIALQFTDTKIVAPDREPATVTISSDGYFELNGIKSEIKAPTKSDGSLVTNSDLPYTGINNYVGSTGTYYISNTHWDNTYRTLANYGGNRNSIGIETAINKGSNIWYTWATLAKLVGGDLLVDNGLLPRDVKQHNTFSGKNCPQTMREAGMWEKFIELVTAEYYLSRYFSDWNITFTHSSEYVNANGLIKSLPDLATPVQYTITLSKGEETYTQQFSCVIPARPSDYAQFVYYDI